MPLRYFNWKLAAVLVISLVVLGVGAFGLRQWHKSNRTEQGSALGNEAYDAGKWQEAVEHLGQYLSVQRDDVVALLKYADAHLNIRPAKGNNIRQAIGAYRAILRVDKNNSEAAVKLAEIYLGVGSPGEAELIARRQLETNPTPELRRMLALALAGQRKFAEAATELKAILQGHPDHILAYETLGQLIEQRPEDFPDGPLQWFDDAVRNNPSSALAYIVRAGFRRRSENLSSALADLEKAEEKDLSDPPVRLRLAREFVDCGTLDRAEEHLAALQETVPTDQGLWQVWAQLVLKSRSPEKMLTVAQEGLRELSSQPWDFMPLAAELFIRSGNLEDANDCISQMAQKDVFPSAVAFLRGLIAAERGDLTEAVRRWRQSMESGNKSVQVRLLLASAQSRLGDTQSAMRQLRTLLSERPNSSEGHLALARLLLQSGKWAEAAEHAAQASALSPQDIKAALVQVQAEMQLLPTDSVDRRQMPDQWGGIQKRLSALNKTRQPPPDVTFWQFQFALRRGDFEEARILLARLKETSFARVRIVTAEAEWLAAQDKINEAIAKLTEATEEFPQAAELVRYLAILLDQQGLRDECEEAIKRALTRIEDPVAQREQALLLALFYTRWDRQDSIYTMLKTVVGRLPNDIPLKRRLLLCEQVIKDSGQAQTLVNQIKLLEGDTGWQWRYEQARVWFVSDNFKSRYPQITSLLQENMLANPSDQASRLLLARSYERGGDTQLAMSRYREALRMSPDDLRVIIPAVAALYGAREYEEAEQVLKRASTRDMYHPELQKLRLQSHLRRGELDSASGVLQDLLSNDPNNQAACLSLAFLEMQQSKFDEASNLLAKLKSHDPNSLPVTAAQIQLNIRRDDPAEALRLCDEIVDRLGNASAYVLRARTYATLGKMDRAAKDINYAVSIEPNDASAWVARSDFHRSVGQLETATADIQEALSVAADDVGIQKRGISLLLASRYPDKVREGKALLQKALESNPDDIGLQLFNARSLVAEGTAPAIDKAEQILLAATRERPEISEAWALMGEIAIKRGQPEKALDAALRGLVHGPDDRVLLLLKANAEAVRSPVLAIPTLRVLHEANPGDVEVAILLANTYVKAGEPKKATDLLKKALAACDERSGRRCRIALAVAQYKNGQKGRAQRQFDALLMSEPNDPAPLLAQAEVLRDDQLWDALSQRVMDWYREHPEDSRTVVSVARDLIANADGRAKEVAEDLLRIVLRDSPDSCEAISVLAILLLETPGRSAESAELYQRLLELEPGNVIAMNNLAWTMSAQQGKHAEALELAKKGLKIAPNYIDLIDTRGVVYYRLGEYEKAIQDFTNCMDLHPGITPATVATRFHLAKALAQVGQRGKAMEELNRALELESRIGGLSTADLAEAQRLLRQLQEGS
ncbi:MAG: tetratricopeptide repeat protein [Phycisphaerales bacterium]|nr:MAG: tetratricopeptide repeat protein [Phycisphaerales bacterium]